MQARDQHILNWATGLSNDSIQHRMSSLGSAACSDVSASTEGIFVDCLIESIWPHTSS
jgi:hypothetical protein